MHRTKSEAKATRPCKPSRALTVQVTIPAKAAPLLKAFAGLAGLSESEYVWRALFASLQCDADTCRDTTLDTLAELEGGAQ